MYNLRFIKNLMYRMKLRYGQPITIVIRQSHSTDVDTGAINKVEVSYVVKRAVVMPNEFKRDFDYDLSYLAANKNFTYGGFFDAGTRAVMVDRSDLPSTYSPSLDHTVLFDSRIYKIAKYFDYEHKQSILFMLKELQGES